MAKNTIEVAASVEAIVNKELVDVLNKIYQEHGLLVNHLAVTWLDTSTYAQHSANVEKLELATSYVPGLARPAPQDVEPFDGS